MRFFFLFLVLCPAFLFGQFSDNFSDNDFSTNPTWFGDTANFTVNNSELQLNDADFSSTVSQLYSTAVTKDSTNWEFYVRLEFPPSGTNFGKIYLQSDQNDLTAPLNGYFIRVGGISGDQDALELYRQTGTEEVLLISGQAGGVGSAPAEARVAVHRDALGNWELFADYSNGTNLVSQGTAFDNIHTEGTYLGVVCTYTSSRKDLFFFDDVVVTPLFSDTEAPQFISATAISSMEVDLFFNEALDDTNLSESNFAINGGLSVLSAELDMDNPSLVHLVLNNNLISEQIYTLTASTISDTNANILTEAAIDFTYVEVYQAQAYDILINEFYPDLSPTIGLPEGEFIELYNRSDKAFDLFNYGISDNTNDFKLLPSYILQPDSYVILCKASLAPLYTVFGEALAVSLPTLNDGGDGIILQNDSGIIIHQISYNRDWITDSDKQNGGWSYELINPGSPCSDIGNWDASENLAGGTPGTKNSIAAVEADIDAPILLQAIPLTSTQLWVEFNEAIHTSNSSFSIDKGIVVNSTSFAGNIVTLDLNTPLEIGTTYTLTAENISDCLGNMNSLASLSFSLPETAAALDIVINEILFDPHAGGVDFVEFYNRSDKTIDMKGLEISNSGNLETRLIETNYLLMPDSFVVVTSSIEETMANYSVQNPQAILQGSLPAFNQTDGNVTLSHAGLIIDSYDYSAAQHYPFLGNVKGVSLERLDPDGISNSPDNWHSAASVVGFATPTYQNSQFFQSEANANSVFSFPYNTFSPDGDGYRDFLILNYVTDSPDFTSNIKIFDSEGRWVQDLVQNESLGTNGSFQWDGATFDGNKARMGIYIFWIELFDSQGKTKHFKETCVLANRF